MTDTVDSRAVMEAIEWRREQVNDAIPENLPVVEPKKLYEASRYLLDAGGKRLRPTILLLAAESIADVPTRSEPYREFPTAEGPIDMMSAAVSIEIIQSFTLIHDDIMDDDDMRRGVPAVHREFDLSTAILAGDTLYAKAFENMLETGSTGDRSVRALSELATTCTQICEGQSMDIEFETVEAVTTEDYLEMVELKTAVLYAAAASIPAILMGEDDYVDPLYQYGLNIGRGFQIQDDLLDLTTPSEKLGKQRGSDLVENKRTIITVHARHQGVDVESLVPTDDVEAVDEATIDDAVAELEDAGSIDFARETAEGLIQDGKENLEVLPDNEARDLLEGIADFLIEREY
ncbi:Geranylgeranyl diphosphate synthase protein [Halorhabdus tiamatea SARL4B]|uniref:Geranylgeranyl diphosphate synthase protein n=1 Tax=Halorhabdus tiamatea SARL4B TaxID=1033806 RepID=F7PNK7_9EURY|nr:polyprenyl synthetase family protein [Halorhabdus tiamatea]ERJ05298.1 Geranylgeranyl diphosphate synthase protein [Halorhabdus tiamatea SARL4B]CCQ33757.1 polyprenyl synthetase [Halorhabdus tiamatea SARL4B]